MRVLLDCDPGIDDTFALIYLAAAHHAGELELDCVTTTAGNVEAVQCAQNAAWILAQCNLPAIPLAAGEAQPLELVLTTTPETHGEHGLGYAHAPERHVASDWDLLWCDAIERGTDDLHLIVTGPLTNLATFARRHPRHFASLRHITVMGGAVNYPGNTTPTAEWNFWVDPHAAAEVFARTPVPITLCSLGVTEQFVLDPPRLDALVGALGDTPVAAVLPEITRFYFEFHEDVGEGYCAQLHDLLTVLIALGRIEVSALDATIDVEAVSELMRGTVAADLRGMWEREPNARVVTAADTDRAWPLIDAACTLHARFTAGDADLKAGYHLKAEE
ncbi:inosine-uridine preferring nucleoside hydrolase [Corynebacterium imitans]|uniref:Nucleoside hydrolase n=1 Tax=Corynebacterium imitans TaxID=156978 RepID=A0A076NN95_9CORY|nr:nucleoside hydrolase [Corynebacterium imitans]AIJ33280.1 nucleoside hydrolase [Corynebacterium imitans]SNV66210.1 inosine-uridine preferring nucleoside hydrolase [Corynebacterium imitans]